MDKLFRFHPRWKEELVCTGPGGSFILELPMGELCAMIGLFTGHLWIPLPKNEIRIDGAMARFISALILGFAGFFLYLDNRPPDSRDDDKFRL